jgi:FkbM family methyltransferase
MLNKEDISDIVELQEYRGIKLKLNFPPIQDAYKLKTSETRFLTEDVLLNKVLYKIPLNPTVLDIGSYIGGSAIWFSIKAGAKVVIAVEPNDYAYKLLVENIKLNKLEGIINPISSIIGNEKYYPSSTLLKQLNVTNEHNISSKIFENKSRKSIDELLENRKDKIDFIKISAKGSEYEIIKGAVNTIKKDRPLILLEVYTSGSIAPINNFDTVDNSMRLLSLLSDLGYVIDSIPEKETYLLIPEEH